MKSTASRHSRGQPHYPNKGVDILHFLPQAGRKDQPFDLPREKLAPFREPVKGKFLCWGMCSRGHMMKQNYEAGVVEAKMAPIKEKSLAWENLGKISDRIRAWNPGRTKKGNGWGRSSRSPCRIRKKVGYFEGKLNPSQTQGDIAKSPSTASMRAWNPWGPCSHASPGS